MRKILIISTVTFFIILAIFLGWYLFLRNPSIPAGEVIRNSLPFGSRDNTDVPFSPIGDTGNSTEELAPFDEFDAPAANLFRLSENPVAGTIVIKRGNQAVARYVDRATGHIYDVLLPTGASSTLPERVKVTNNTLPKIYEAYFRSDGNTVLLRFLKDDSDVVENLSLTLTSPRSTSTLYAVSSTILRGDIGSVAPGPGNTLFYVLRDTSSIVSSAFNGTGLRTLLTSVFNDWRLSVAGNNLVTYTKASANVSGYAYTLNISNGTLTKILGPLNGLVALSNSSGNRVLYSYVENNRTKLFAKNLANNIFSEILPTTIAEKCLWSSRDAGMLFCGAPIDGLKTGEPDSWYRGKTHFSDRIWLFDTNIDIAQVLIEPKQSLGIDIDVSEPRLSPDEDYLIFINKTDLSLWALKLR